MYNKPLYQHWVDKYGEIDAVKRSKIHGEKISKANRGNRKMLTDEQKLLIEFLFSKGANVMDIYRKTGVSRYLIKRFLMQSGLKDYSQDKLLNYSYTH